MPDYHRRCNLLARRLDHGHILFAWRLADLGRYSIYCGMLVLGLTLETLSRSKNFFLQNELLRPHRLSLRQTATSIGLLVLYLVAAKDAFISRVFLFNFVPWLYIALLFSHYYLPSLFGVGNFPS